MEKAPDFASALKDDFEEYVGFMTKLGRNFRVEITILKAFDRHLVDAGAESVVPELVDEFAFAPEGLSNQQYLKRRSVAKGFADYVALKHGGDVIPQGPRLAKDGKYIAHHYTDEEIGMLIKRLIPRRKGEKYRIVSHAHQSIVGLLSATGMRVSEALGLSVSDVDLSEGVVFIKATKFKKKRYVPLHPTVTAMLREYVSDRDGVFPRGEGDGPFFLSSCGTALSYSTFGSAFKRAAREAGLCKDGEEVRIHDLRHTFAVNRMVAWYSEGIDPSDKLAALATYMGHIKFESSIYYLDMKAEAMALGSKGFKLNGGAHDEA